MNITIPFESTYQMLDLVKMAVLYFDKVNILCPMFDEDKHYFSMEIYNHMKVLVDEHVVDVEFVPIFSDVSSLGWYNLMEDLAVEGLTCDTDTSEIDRLMKLEWVKEYLKTTRPDDEPVVEWFMESSNNMLFQNEFQIVKTFEALCSGKNVALEAASILLPDYKRMSFEDILDVRYHAKDQLLEMRDYIDELTQYDKYDNFTELQSYVTRKINKSIMEFNTKVTECKISFFQKLLQELKDPVSYTPLLATFFAGIPKQIAFAASLGLITADAGLEYIKRRKELKNEALFFRLKL